MMRSFVASAVGRRLAVGISMLLFASVARGDDAFYHVPVRDLEIVEGQLPKPANNEILVRPTLGYRAVQFVSSYAVLDGDGEMYTNDAARRGYFARGTEIEPSAVVIRAPKGRDVTGVLYVPNADWSGLQKVKFRVPVKSADDSNREGFYRTKEQHFRSLIDRGLPGGSWFRYQAREAEAALSGKPAAEFTAERRQPGRDVDETQLEDTFAVFSGGRAVSENLQLDRLLPLSEPEVASVDLASIEGITVREMDWQALTKDIHPELDPLAKSLPSDQHALLFPNFAAMVRMMDEAQLNGTPILQTVQPRSESARSRERYEKQLCLSVTALSRLLGDQVVASVAFTGSDPYLRTGTDVAVLFEAKNAPVLLTYVAAQQTAAIAANPQCQNVKGALGETSYVGAVSPDRSVCSYLAQIGNTVVVTNSLFQLQRIVDTEAGREESLASLPEYHFFRERYKRGGDETSLLIVTDKTIRRWCGPKWRIATSRRTRAAAIMAQHQAGSMKDLVDGTAQQQMIETKLHVPDLGTMRLTKSGVSSSTYGTLDFLTPIAELDFTKVTKAEADTYNRWREGYQRNWSQFFDPIAVSLSVGDERLFADLTVMPLIASSEYRELIEIASGAELKPTSGDQHGDALLHWALAVNTKSAWIGRADNLLERLGKKGLLGWLGQSISVYADPDPFWAELSQAAQEGEDGPERFVERNIRRIPVVVNAEVTDPLKLAFFLATARAWLEQTAPGNLIWTTLEHNGKPYVRITPTPNGGIIAVPAEVGELALYYSPGPQLLIITLNEDALKRALDRQAKAKQDAEKQGTGAKATDSAESKPAPHIEPPRPWLGSSMALQVDRQVLDMFEAAFGRSDYKSMMQAQCWANLPILNEWKRLFPDRDPVALHEQYWQTTLVCPGGGKYVWNEKFQTMESTVFGHPGEPKSGPPSMIPPSLASARSLDFGLTFENQGLRAKVAILRSSSK